MPTMADTVCSQIGPAVREDGNRHYSYEELEEDCRDLKSRAPLRVAALKRMLGR